MKRIIVVFIIFALLCCGCTQRKEGEAKTGTESTTAPDSNDTIHIVGDAETEFGELNVSAIFDYAFTDIYDLFRTADLVVKVTYSKDVESYVSNSDLPTTRSDFTVKSVLKGNYMEEAVFADYYGGTVSLYQMIAEMSQDQIKQFGYDKYTEEEAKNIPVSFYNEIFNEHFSNDKEYLLMLSYDAENDIYFIRAGIYGAPEVDGDKVYNRAAGEYVEISSLTDDKE